MGKGAKRLPFFPFLAPMNEVQKEPVLASVLAKCYSFYVKVFYVMGKALTGELSCPCDRSCWLLEFLNPFIKLEKHPVD